MGFPGGSDGKESITIIIKNLGFKKKKKKLLDPGTISYTLLRFRR